MSMLQVAKARLLGKDVRRPPSPVDARDMYPTVCYSGHDLTPGPSGRLLDLAMDAVERVLDRQTDLTDVEARPNVPEYFPFWPGEHYHLLAGVVQVLKPRVVVEIGTFTGLSALTLKKYLPAHGRMATFDVKAWSGFDDTVLNDADFADGRLVQHLDDLTDPATFERHRDLLESTEFFFIEAPKDGVFEYKLMELFRTLKFRAPSPPIALFDDTRLWSMLRFWRELPYPKLDVTSWGAWSGTGLAEFTRPG